MGAMPGISYFPSKLPYKYFRCPTFNDSIRNGVSVLCAELEIPDKLYNFKLKSNSFDLLVYLSYTAYTAYT